MDDVGGPPEGAEPEGASESRPRRPTIYQVAERAGVSPSTVSRVINGGRVTEATRSRVADAIAQLGFRPLGAAAALRRQTAGTVLVAVPDVRNPFYGELVHDLEGEARARNLNTLVMNTDRQEALERLALDLAQRKVADGVIVSEFLSSAVVRQFVRSGIPCIVVGSEAPIGGITVVDTDDRTGGRLAGEHLASLGHRRVVMVREGERELPTDHQRAQGALAALRSRFGEAAAVVSHAPPSRSRAWIRSFLRTLAATGATAVFAGNDLLAVQVMAALRLHEPSVLTSLSVVGYDGTFLSEMAGITTVSQPIDEMARAAVRELIAQLSGESVSPRRIVLEPQLVARSSSKPAEPVRQEETLP